MGKFNRSDRSGGDFKKKGFGRSGRGDRSDFGPRPSMHQAICSECGNPCEVPFKPTGEKPVYCNDCFRSKRDGGFKYQSSAPAKSFSAPTISKDQLESLNSKLDQIIKLLSATEKPQTEESSAKSVKAVKVKKTEKKVKAPKAASKKKK